MAYLAQTSEALDEVMANRSMGFGEHCASNLETGIPGLDVGYRQFDPTRDQVGQIDLMSPMAECLGDYQVKLVIPNYPLHISVVTDYTSAVQHPSFDRTKTVLAEDIGQAIEGALPGMTDRVEYFAVGDAVPDGLGIDVETIRTDDSGATAEAIKQIVFDGLTFVISSFSNLDFTRDQVQDALVAVKVNHPLERRIPDGLRRTIVLGGLTELNPRKKKDLQAYNLALQQQHQEVVARLEAAGAGVASIVASRDPHGYDLDAADTEISNAIRTVSNL